MYMYSMYAQHLFAQIALGSELIAPADPSLPGRVSHVGREGALARPEVPDLIRPIRPSRTGPTIAAS